MFFDNKLVVDPPAEYGEKICIQLQLDVNDVPKFLEELRAEEKVLEVKVLRFRGYYSVHTSLKSEQIPLFIEQLKLKYPLNHAYHDSPVAGIKLQSLSSS